MGDIVFDQSALHSFLKFLEICPVEISAHVAVMAPGNGALGLKDWLHVFSESILLRTGVRRDIVIHTGIEKDQAGETRTQYGEGSILHFPVI